MADVAAAAGALPVLGLGIGDNPPSFRALVAAGVAVDYVQVYAGDFLDDPASIERELPAGVRSHFHSNRLSPLGADPIPADLLATTRRIADALAAPWVCEDLGVWRLDGRAPFANEFWPPVLDDDALDLLAARLGPLTGALGRPFVCELPPLELVVGPLEMATFFRRLAARSGALFVLDVSHWLKYANQVERDPLAMLAEFPLDHVVELHIAGGKRVPGPRWYDEEHGAPLLPECVALLDAVVPRVPNLRAITLETHSAPVEVAAASFATLAALPSVAALRARRDAVGPSVGAVAASSASPPEVLEVLARPGRPALARRQRVVRDLLEEPDAAAALAEGRYPLDPDDVGVFRALPAVEWTEANARHLRRLRYVFAGAPRLTTIVAHAVDDVADLARRVRRARPDGVTPTLGELLELLADGDALPAWATDLVRFELDVHRVQAGAPPASAARPGPTAGSHVVAYPRPIVATFRAVTRREALPPTRVTEMLFDVDGERCAVRELG